MLGVATSAGIENLTWMDDACSAHDLCVFLVAAAECAHVVNVRHTAAVVSIAALMLLGMSNRVA